MGGIVDYFAQGGISENHVAQIAPAGTNRMWAEPETGGEAYIPLSGAKRKRSQDILGVVARRFGYGLTSIGDLRKQQNFADGGIVDPQPVRTGTVTTNVGPTTNNHSVRQPIQFMGDIQTRDMQEVVEFANRQKRINSLTGS